MAEKQEMEPERQNVLCVLYANELLRHIARAMRRYSRIESPISLNREIMEDSRESCEIFGGTEEVQYNNLELNEFRSWLTAG